MIKVMLVDDHQIIRDGIRQLLEDDPGIAVVAEANHVDEALKKLASAAPDIIITDLSMPRKSGFDLIKAVGETHPGLAVIVLSMHIEDVYIKRAIGMGVKGYLPKDISKDQLVSAIYSVAEGDTYFSDQVTQVLMKDMLKRASGQAKPERPEEKLTQREQEIVDLIMEGLSSSQIAKKLFISTRTVENHRANIMAKLELKNTIELVKYMLENKHANLGYHLG